MEQGTRAALVLGVSVLLLSTFVAVSYAQMMSRNSGQDLYSQMMSNSGGMGMNSGDHTGDMGDMMDGMGGMNAETDCHGFKMS